MKQKPSCWVITEGLKGTENQCVGIAEMLMLSPIIKKISLTQPWKILSPYFGLECETTFIGDSLAPPYPDLLITGGRKAIAASRYIKKKSKGNTVTLHVLDPRISSKHFDFVTVPQHDSMRGDNVIVTHATPNRITVRKLQEGKCAFPFLEKLSAPRVAVLIGGNSKAYRFDMKTAQKLVQDLRALKDVSLMVTLSRRTPPEIATYIRSSLTGDHVYIWDGTGENPYFGLLGWADYICATADSTSMLSEACTTGKPTYMIPLHETGQMRRIKKLHSTLIEHGALRVFDGCLETWHYTPLNDSQLVASRIKPYIKL